MPEQRLKEWAARRDYRIALAGTDVLREVRQELEARRASGAIDAKLFRRYLAGFSCLDESAGKTPRLLVMLAVPRPVHVLPVTFGGKTLRGLIPPTYVHYRKTFADVLSDMKSEALGPGVGAEILKAPLKSAAVHMGLAFYGRNNITYVPGRGSGHQLCGYVIEAPPPEETRARRGRASTAGVESALERCASCRACLEICPTRAILPERFLIAADRCYTYHSEKRSAFPEGTVKPRRLCMVGCMDCQEVCPENKNKLNYEAAGFELSEAETAALIAMGKGKSVRDTAGPGSGTEMPPEEASVREKLDSLGLTEDISLFGRNLAYWLEAA